MTDPWKQAFLCESKVAEIMAKQADRGVRVNQVKAGFYIHVLNEKILHLDSIAVPQMPKMMEKGCVATAPYLKTGALKKNVVDWFEKVGFEFEVDGPFCGINWVPFDMGKTERIKEHLVTLGWKPDTWKFKDLTMHASIKRPLNPDEQKAKIEKYMEELRNTNLGKLRMQLLGLKPGTMTVRQVKEFLLKKRKVPAGAKLTEASLSQFEGGEIGTVLKQRLTLAHRRSLIQGVRDLVRPDGRIEARAISIGTPTMRMRHAGVVNIPKAAKYVLFGAHCRDLFESSYCEWDQNPVGIVYHRIDDKGKDHRTFIPAGRRVLLGYDGAGLELRMLAHYVNDAEYTRQILEGDIHSFNQALAGLPTRDDAKTFIYAFLYGAGDQKIGDIVGGTKQDGARLKAQFLESLPALQALIDSVRAEGENGYVIGIDGRKLWLRKDDRGRPMVHKALNLLLQGAGAVVMKYAMVLLDEAIEAEGLDAWKVIDMHDEGQYDVLPRDVKRVRELMDICVKKAGELLGMNIPLASDSIAGPSWKYTH
uniref:DNA-directed DNA polymerase n=3 Tax=unclassified bacterial viruses TaxID=12333 RepID=A0AAU6VZT6_9VIRU